MFSPLGRIFVMTYLTINVQCSCLKCRNCVDIKTAVPIFLLYVRLLLFKIYVLRSQSRFFYFFAFSFVFELGSMAICRRIQRLIIGKSPRQCLSQSILPAKRAAHGFVDGHGKCDIVQSFCMLKLFDCIPGY